MFTLYTLTPQGYNRLADIRANEDFIRKIKFALEAEGTAVDYADTDVWRHWMDEINTTEDMPIEENTALEAA